MPQLSLNPLPQGWFGGKDRNKNVRSKDIMRRLASERLSHPKLPGGIHFFPKGIKHAIATGSSHALERLLRSSDSLAFALSHGDCRVDAVHHEKRHYIDRAWHIRHRLVIDGRPFLMDATVLHHTQENRNLVYDIKLTEKHKKIGQATKTRARRGGG